jgi:hypothetical protein
MLADAARGSIMHIRRKRLKTEIIASPMFRRAHTMSLSSRVNKETTLSEPGIPNGREQEHAQVFYPGVSDFAAAATIELHGGQEVEENFALSAEPVYKISGTVLAQDQVSPQAVFARIAGTGYDFTENAAVQDGKFQTALPAGSYLVHAFAPGGLLLSNAGAPVDVSSDASNVRIALARTPSIAVTVRQESDSGTTVSGRCFTSSQIRRSKPALVIERTFCEEHRYLVGSTIKRDSKCRARCI